ncbi:MAG: hypothetical protein ACJAS1_005473 [Oleiphilaceae bacterium]|jgi:hypothetical protein
MVKYIWDIDDNNAITASKGAFGKAEFSLNGKPLIEKIKFKKNQVHEVEIDDGRKVTIQMQQPQIIGSVTFELKVNGELLLPNLDVFKKICSSCKTVNKPNNIFCTKCGNSLPSAESMIGKQKVKGAKTAITVLAFMFAIFGVGMFYMQQDSVDQAMTNLAQYEDNQIWSELVNGKQVTVGELKAQIRAEQWSSLILNGILAILMFGLAFWAKTKPLPAIIIASAIYGVVIVGSAIYDPKTIAQGWIIKIIIISFLYNGIKSALALRQIEGK